MCNFDQLTHLTILIHLYIIKLLVNLAQLLASLMLTSDICLFITTQNGNKQLKKKKIQFAIRWGFWLHIHQRVYHLCITCTYSETKNTVGSWNAKALYFPMNDPPIPPQLNE